MANSFNISVLPQIAALETKVDTIDTVVDAIRATDVPALDTKLTIIDTVADQIRDIDVPNIQANIDANETKIDAETAIIADIHDTDLPAVSALISALPQTVRAALQVDSTDLTSTSYVDLVNISDSGLLYIIWVDTPAGDTCTFKITIDGIVSTELTVLADALNYIFPLRSLGATLELDKQTEHIMFHLQFQTSLLIQGKVSGDTSLVRILYAVD